ncbi:class I SAM-dependent methyltransferase [Thiorhodovibrio frisius]|uniref:Class I SAM-dependent methyltransferase n=1 Tax=Thiorhodovibrio frisius TaxID=631362 RepID=H8YVU6_9GAMM|nr:class I SAM-dependent methyltransferase [Thiorhodovibrio frisius]EIC23737.1 hypothetical protein Thi970DRAFT_00242 [Thiorhodovibrio frisius]WPL20144.1 hypothetical protein Thiofri_00206 [Thiorhodovibrio frisius]
MIPSDSPPPLDSLFLWRTARTIQSGDLPRARAMARHALRTGVDRARIARALIGELCQSGRAMTRNHSDRAPATSHWSLGLELGFPPMRVPATPRLTDEAEQHHQAGRYREAAQCWQDVADLLQENTPAHIYQRLGEAMASNPHGFGGTAEENHLWGDCHKHDVLAWLHAQLGTETYLEIGVDEGISLARAPGRAIGIDPRPDLHLQAALSAQAQILTASSDAFFRDQARACLQPPPDLVFIDGMHLFEFALRDLINVERHAAPHTLVAIDDIYPCHPTQAERHRRSGTWTGDIWKLHAILRTSRPELTLVALNAHTTGLLLIAGLDPEDRVLAASYPAEVRRHLHSGPPPPAVLTRQGAIPSDHPLVGELVAVLKHAKAEGWSVAQMREGLASLQPALAAAEFEYKGLAEAGVGRCGLNLLMPGGPVKVQVYWPQPQHPTHHEAASTLYWVRPGDWVQIRFQIPDGLDLSQQPLRLDPADRPGRVRIAALRVRAAESEALLFSAETPEAFAALTLQGDARQLATAPELLIACEGEDPIIVLPRLANLAPSTAGARPGWLEVRMMIEVDADAEMPSHPGATPTAEHSDNI